ncbi:hypothetical protein B0O99DRAFT_627397 [Bisporella sp. PMI_857]|nr:hypothetical protein B0O99DRAFT_627397 [Bisporella sp. PMI_857]
MEFNIFAMPPSAILLLLSAAFRVTNALPWSGPIPTSVYQADEWSPRPTQFPVDPKELFRRKTPDIRVCGWLGGTSSEPAVCPTGSSCVRAMNHGYVGCCKIGESSCTEGVYTSCVDKNSQQETTGPQIKNNGIYTCPDDTLCYRNTYPGSYLQWGCGKTDQATKVETTYSGQASDVLLQVVYRKITFSPMTVSATTSSESSSTTEQTTTTTEESRSTPPPASTTSATESTSTTAGNTQAATTGAGEEGEGKSKSKVSGGVIAAGVIGSAAFVIALLGIILFFLRRRRNQQRKDRGTFMNMKASESSNPSPGSSQGQIPFPPVLPYSPEDFHTNEIQTQSHPYSQPYVQPDTPPPVEISRAVLTPPTEYQGIDQRMREDSNVSLGVPPSSYYGTSLENTPSMYGTSPQLNVDGLHGISEIENFSSSFNAAISQMSPPSPPPPQMSVMTQPPSHDNYGAGSGYGGMGAEISMGAAGVAATVGGRDRGVGHTYTSGYSPIDEDDYGTMEDYGPVGDYEPVDGYDPLNKEMGMATTVRAPPSYQPVSGFRPETVRTESWETPAVRTATPPNAPIQERVSDSTPRYQLTDRPPSRGVPVLYTPGQLKAQKGVRQKQSYDGKNGDDLQA